MQTKKLSVCNYHISISRNFKKRINSINKLHVLILPLIILFLFIGISPLINFYKELTNLSKNTSVSEFKLDINALSETAEIIESERQLNMHSNINSFGSDGNALTIEEISSDLKSALINIADINNDKKLSTQEISKLQIMRLKAEDFQKELDRRKYTLQSADHNLKNYIVITKGKYEGTVLYNGPLKFIDTENKQYLGLELFNQ